MVMNWLPRWMELGLVLSASWLVAGLFATDHIPTPSKLNSSVQPVAEQPLDVDLFKTVHLFGKAAEAEKKEEQPVVVTASKLNIKLIGTVVAGSKSAAMVMINASKEHQVFFVGEVMQPGIVLKSVLATEITVDNQGKRERIAIEEGEELVMEPTSQPQAAAAPHARRPQPVERQINRGNLEKQMRNFSTLLSQARVTPHFTDKKADGFTISEIVKGSLYEEVGLQNGDVIQKVNGEAVTSAEQAMRMYKELQNATDINVEINRGGSVQQVSYSIQ